MLTKLWIDGGPAAALSGRTFEVRNPADGALLAKVSEGGAADVDAAVDAAVRAASGPWGKMQARERGKILLKIAALIREAGFTSVKVEPIMGGLVAIHGTNAPWLIGKAVSHGCRAIQFTSRLPSASSSRTWGPLRSNSPRRR